MERLLGDSEISAAEEEVYLLILDGKATTVTAVAEKLRRPRTKVMDAVVRLRDLGFVTKTLTRPAKLSAVPPESALHIYALRQQDRIERLRTAAAELQQRYRAATRPLEAVDQVEILIGELAVGRRFFEMIRRAEIEVLGLDAPPYGGDAPDEPLGVNADEIEQLGRGVRFRVIYDVKALEFPGNLTNIETYAMAGEEARTLTHVPLKLAIVDASQALLPVAAEEKRGAEEALYIQSTSLMRILVLFFESLWERAQPLALAADAVLGAQGVDERLLGLLAAGLKDAAIARQLGTSVRTVGRRTEQLLRRLDAHTRFQAGALAAQRGLLTRDRDTGSTA